MRITRPSAGSSAASNVQLEGMVKNESSLSALSLSKSAVRVFFEPQADNSMSRSRAGTIADNAMHLFVRLFAPVFMFFRFIICSFSLSIRSFGSAVIAGQKYILFFAGSQSE